MKRLLLHQQQGSAMLFTLLALIALFGAIGLAVDSGHLIINKTRLQNGLDAAALSAAIAVNADPARNTANATAAGRATFDLFKATSGNNELASVAAASLDFTYSRTLNPFVPGSVPPTFVKVTTAALSVSPILVQVVGGAAANPISVGAQSTAGAVGQNCTLVPFVLCAKTTPLDTNCDDDTTRRNDNGTPANAEDDFSEAGQDGIPDCFGYNTGQKLSLVQACNGNNTCNLDTNLETGNFNLLNIGDPGADAIRDALTGTRNICGALGNNLDTQPGYAWGPVRQGIDNRFGSDTNTTVYASNLTPATPNGTSAHSQYINSNSGNGRREMAVPIGDCSGLQTGNSIIPRVGVGCLFLTEQAVQQGPNKQIRAEFIKACQQNGTWDPVNAMLGGPYKVVLFKTSTSNDS